MPARICHMARSLFGMFSRVAFFACGMISILLSNGYRALQRVDPDVHSGLPLFSNALIVIGGFSDFLLFLRSSQLRGSRGQAKHRLIKTFSRFPSRW